MFSRYYQSELTYLRELGREFSEANPSLAGLFAEQGGDPDVDRLLEGFAFLTSRIRERIDDAVPEVIEAVAQLVAPQLVRTLPACSIVEFRPHHASMRGSHHIERGAELASQPVQGTPCTFRTTSHIDLLPLQLEGATMDAVQESAPKIRLRFRHEGKTSPWPEDGSLRLFLQGSYGLASTVFLWMHQHLSRVTLHGMSTQRIVPKRNLVPVGINPNFELLPWPELAPGGLRLAQEYLTLPSKLLFWELRGLNKMLSAEELGDTFDITFTFDDPPKLPERLDSDLFRMHCVPVINLFDVGGDPINRDVRTSEYLLRAAGVNPHHAEVYSVNSLIGISGRQQSRRNYAPFYHFSHLEKNAKDRAFFTTRRSPSPIDNATDTYISVMTPVDVAPEFDEEVLSLELTCTNRTLPTELRQGDIRHSTPNSPTLADFGNITEVTRPCRPPVGAEMHWRLVSHVALNVNTLTEAGALRALLHHYNRYTESDHQKNRANELRINAVRSVTTETEKRIVDRMPLRGLHTKIELDASGYTSTGDAFLFGCALNWLFITETPLNSYHRLTVTLHPSGIEFQWQPTTGTQPIL